MIYCCKSFTKQAPQGLSGADMIERKFLKEVEVYQRVKHFHQVFF
jgi:hypothetical protein